MSRNYRNSRTDRLIITWVPIWYSQGNPGKIGMTLCPGKFEPWSMSGGWNRSMDLDIRELKKAEVGHVVSLVTTEEMQELEVMDLGKKLHAAGLTWYHLPTPDAEVPTDRWAIHSIRTIIKLMPNFSEGKRVIVHCKGGISRAGIFTCMVIWLMTELPMSKAIEMVRDLRDRRGINKQQEQYLLDFEVNYQTWVQGICQLGQWQEEMI